MTPEELQAKIAELNTREKFVTRRLATQTAKVNSILEEQKELRAERAEIARQLAELYKQEVGNG